MELAVVFGEFSINALAVIGQVDDALCYDHAEKHEAEEADQEAEHHATAGEYFVEQRAFIPMSDNGVEDKPSEVPPEEQAGFETHHQKEHEPDHAADPRCYFLFFCVHRTLPQTCFILASADMVELKNCWEDTGKLGVCQW